MTVPLSAYLWGDDGSLVRAGRGTELDLTPLVLLRSNSFDGGVVDGPVATDLAATSGDAFDVVAGAVIYDSSYAVVAGGLSARCGDAVETGYVEWRFGDLDTLVGRMYLLYDESGRISGDRVVQVRAPDSTTVFSVYVNLESLSIRDVSNIAVGQLDLAPISDAWFRLEWKFTISTGDYEVRLFNDAHALVPDGSLTGNANLGVLPVSAIRLGQTGGPTLTLHIDEVALAEGPDFIGPVKETS